MTVFNGTRLALGLLFALAAPLAHAADEHFMADGAAVGGYDVVAYHLQNSPALGSAAFTSVYQGVEWRFASAANRDLFASDPARYAPAYGGWCSAGASKGKKVTTRPDLFAVVDGQLYLNSSPAAHEGLFLKDTAGVIAKGEGNWKRIFATEADKL